MNKKSYKLLLLKLLTDEEATMKELVYTSQNTLS